MLPKTYKDLITVLTEKTGLGLIAWNKGECQFAYEAVVEKTRILLDKYFATETDKTVACLNLSIFDKNKTLREEIVLCKNGKEEEDDYILLENLYRQVEVFMGSKSIKETMPLIASITQSIQSL